MVGDQVEVLYLFYVINDEDNLVVKVLESTDYLHVDVIPG